MCGSICNLFLIKDRTLLLRFYEFLKFILLKIPRFMSSFYSYIEIMNTVHLYNVNK